MDAPILITRENAIEYKDVKMKIQIQRTAKSLGVHDGSALRSAEPSAALLLARDGLDEDTAEGGEDIGLECRQTPELMREGEDPLTDGDVGQDAIDEVRSFVAHPP